MKPNAQRIAAIVAAALALSACATAEHDLQPVADSLHTPEMEAAIKAAEPGAPRVPQGRT